MAILLHTAAIAFTLYALPLADAESVFNGLHSLNSPSTVAELFQGNTAGPVGSQAWQSSYPVAYSSPPISSTPKAWTDRLAQVVASPDFPSFGPCAKSGGPWISSNGTNLVGSNPEVCFFTSGCVSPRDIMVAGQGNIGVTFDDGPSDASPTLYDFLDKNNISDIATHFLIGSNIVSYPDEFLQLKDNGGHMAVHTWSHPYMTTLSNEAILAELGWTMQIMIDSNSGRIPRFWRPPYGDIDNRVRMIAQEVFGLTHVVWNADSRDWSIADGTPRSTVINTMTKYLTGDKKDGLIFLEHELDSNDVSVFLEMYPQMLSNGWNLNNIPDTFDLPWYQNAESNSSIPLSQGFVQTASVVNPTAYSLPPATIVAAATSSGLNSSSVTSITHATASSSTAIFTSTVKPPAMTTSSSTLTSSSTVTRSTVSTSAGTQATTGYVLHVQLVVVVLVTISSFIG